MNMEYTKIKNPNFPFRLKKYPVFFRDEQVIEFINVTLDENGNFKHFPGVEENEEWLKEKRVRIIPDVHYEATFYRLDENHCLVLWLMQPDGMYWMDDDGFGIEDDLSIEMYGIVDNAGNFSNQFKLFEIDKTRYIHDFDDIVPTYK